MNALIATILSALLFSNFSLANSAKGNDWSPRYPREEIAPIFTRTVKGQLVISSHTPGVNGHWFKAFPVQGGKSYQFSAYRVAENVESERRSCLVRIEWYGSDGKLVESPHKVNPDYLGGDSDMARPDYPRDRKRLNNGSVLVQDTYIAPAKATHAHVQLHLRWTDKGK